VNDLSASEYPEVGDGRFKLDAGVPGLRSDSVDGDEAVTCADDLLQLAREFLVRLGPAFRCPDHTLAAAIRLASVVGQIRVLIGDLGIE
jgi:hypothetical protein